MPGVQADRIRRRDVRDTTAKVEPEFQLTVDQVQTDKVASAVVHLAVVEQETVTRAGEEPELDGERFRDAVQTR